MKPERLQKILANAGIASRRGAEELIAAGRVTVNGRLASIGDRATPGEDSVEVDGVEVPAEVERRYVILNKPAGVITTVEDARGRTTVLDVLPKSITDGTRLFPVGRLDMDSTGLILLTNDGFLSERLMHPRFEVQREYIVEVRPVPRAEDIAKLRKGIFLEDGNTGPAKVSLMAKSGGTGLIRMVIHTGRKRQIRRSFEALSYRVVSLNRVRVGSLSLGSLGPGEFRELRTDEVRRLYIEAGM
jgi:pseudouridine synthase